MFKCFKEYFTVYSTSRQVKIKSKFLALTNVIFVITILFAYIGSLEFDLRNVYQKPCLVHGAMVSKVKGVLSTEDLDDALFQVADPKTYKRIWDTADLIFPPHGGDGEDGGFVVVTNIIITTNQTRGNCSGSYKAELILCRRDVDCKRGLTLPIVSGVLTGKCSNVTGTCEVSSWCPVEEDLLPLKTNLSLLEGVQNFTVMLKNSAEFPDCGPAYHRRNILENATTEFLSSCIYDNRKERTCPIFRLGDIVKWSGYNFSDVAKTGGVFRIEARWTCDFDWGHSVDDCFPKYYFSRIDRTDAKISPGWNFRSATYHEGDRRTLQKMYGIKILIEVTGEGKRFDIRQLILTLGATIGLFSLAPLVCDFLFELLCLLKTVYPFYKRYSDFSMKLRYSDAEDYQSSEAIPTKFELSSVSNDNFI